MTRTPFKTVPVVLAALMALGVGLLGTATVGNAAGAITKAQVKKIAKKVVKKSARNLTVANATTLAKKPAATYLTSTWSYTLAGHAPSESRVYAFPGLPAGTYLVDYSVYMNVVGTGMVCDIRVGSQDYSAVGFGVPSANSDNSSATGSTVVTTTAGNVVLECFTSDPGLLSVNTTDSVRSTVTFTKIDASTTAQTTSVAGPDAARGSRR